MLCLLILQAANSKAANLTLVFHSISTYSDGNPPILQYKGSPTTVADNR